MRNLAMQRKLESGEAINVAEYGEEIYDGVWRLNVDPLDRHLLDSDWCYVGDEREEWIWSIGRSRETGTYFASTSTIFAQHPGFECAWLR